MKELMEEATFLAFENGENNYQDGGPFGAVVVRGNEIIGRGKNSVIKSNDPTAHAEINAIRASCKKLNTNDLTGCILYTNCYPCPMCLSAIIWSNIKEVYYGNSKEDANEIGFRDDIIYEYIKGNTKDLINLNQIDRDITIKVFEDFKNNKDKIMY